MQSDLGDSCRRIQQDLNEAKTVLFIETPCYAVGLKAFIDDLIFKDNLYICDLICHRSPSPRIWNDYKIFLEEEFTEELINI